MIDFSPYLLKPTLKLRRYNTTIEKRTLWRRSTTMYSDMGWYEFRLGCPICYRASLLLDFVQSVFYTAIWYTGNVLCSFGLPSQRKRYENENLNTQILCDKRLFGEFLICRTSVRFRVYILVYDMIIRHWYTANRSWILYFPTNAQYSWLWKSFFRSWLRTSGLPGRNP